MLTLYQNLTLQDMKEAEIALVNQGEGCTIYTIQFLMDTDSEFEKFVNKFKNDAELFEL